MSAYRMDAHRIAHRWRDCDRHEPNCQNADIVPDQLARVLDEDPELGESLDPELLTAASTAAVAGTIDLSSEWPSSWPTGVRHGLGLLVLDGLLLRRVGLDGRFGAELLGQGDLLRPWQDEDAVASIPSTFGWRVLKRCRVALLDLDFAARIAPYPEIHGQLLARAIRRSHYLTINIAITHQPRVETRVHMLLWHLADRWGTVRSDGVLLPIKLTHATLSELAAASRPTVSAALGALERSGGISRARSGWLLRGSPPGSYKSSRRLPGRVPRVLVADGVRADPRAAHGPLHTI
jgi:CRP/FNR family cyclic AMP-dependent transcriptional regulator